MIDGPTSDFRLTLAPSFARRNDVLPLVTLYSERHVSAQEKLSDFFRRDVPSFQAANAPTRVYRLIDARDAGRLCTTALAIARESGFDDEVFPDLSFSDNGIATAKRFLEDGAVRQRLAQVYPDWLSRWSEQMTFWQNGGPKAYVRHRRSSCARPT